MGGGDRELLASLRSYEDPARGIREEFLQPVFGGGRTIAVLAAPLGEARGLGWVICHSFGMEQFYLQSVEVDAARRLAAAGYRTLRYHGQGYGDSDGRTEDVSVGSHVADALDAVRLLGERVASVGLLGGRFGGAVAALAADRSGARAVILWDPVVSGKRYAESLVRLHVIGQMAQHGRSRAAARDPMQTLAEEGVLDIQGFPLREEVFNEIAGFSLETDVRSFAGGSRVVQLSRTPRPRPELERLVRHLEGLGGRSSLEVLVHPEAPLFGQQRYRVSADGVKGDSQAGVCGELAERTLRLALDLETPPSPAHPPAEGDG